MATIVIADDKGSNRQFLATLFGYFGHHVVEAEDGREALALVALHRPDLLFTDVLMPAMDGLELARRIRGDPKLAAIPIIFYTATYRGSGFKKIAAELGVDVVIAKPSEPQAILNAIGGVLGVPPAVLSNNPEIRFKAAPQNRMTEEFFGTVEDLGATVLRLNATIELGIDLTRERDPARLVETFCRGAQDIIGAKYAACAMTAIEGNALEHLHTCGLPPETADLLRDTARQGNLFQWMRKTRSADRRHLLRGDRQRVGLPEEHPMIDSFLGIPIHGSTGDPGWLYLAEKFNGDSFTDEDERLASTLAWQAGVAYQNAYLHNDNARKARELERQAVLLAEEIGERERAEQRRMALDVLLRDAIESISGGFLITDADDRLVLFNQKLSNFFPDCVDMLRTGAPYRDFLWARIVRGYYPEAIGREEAWFAEAMVRHHDANDQVEIRLPDGRWLLVTERRMHDGGIASVSLDITSLKAAEEAIRHGEEQFRRVFETSLDLIVVTDSTGCLIRISPSATPLLGYDPDELVGRSGVDLVYSEDLDATREAMRTARRNSKTQNFDCRYVRKDGRIVNLWWTGLWSASEQQFFFIGRDMTERQEAERLLRVSEERLKQAQRLAHMGSDIRNLCTDEAEWSDETYRIFGLSRETYVTTTENFLKLLHPDDLETVLATREQIRKGICPTPFEYRIIRPDGSERQVYRETELIRDETGKPLYLVGTVHDVTEQRQTERQLRQAQKMEALGTLAGGMAHDINNCLVPILSLSELVLETAPAGGSPRNCVELIKEAGERIRDLVRRILIFSRHDAIARAPFDLVVEFAESIRLLRATLPATIDLRSRVGLDEAIVDGDRGQIGQVLLNLCVNAADAIGDGGGTIEVFLDGVDLAEPLDAVEGVIAPGRYYRLRATDNGCGMNEATIARIFEPFYTTKPPGKGTGLGLSMVHTIVLAHFGRISVESRPGAGTTFDIYLPPGDGAIREH